MRGISGGMSGFNYNQRGDDMDIRKIEVAVSLREDEVRMFGFELLKDLDILYDYWHRGEVDWFLAYFKQVKEKVSNQMCPDSDGGDILKVIYPELCEEGFGTYVGG